MATSHAHFSIIESNQFRELAHLVLTLNVGTDKSIRSYLSSRLSQVLSYASDVNYQLESQKQRCDAAEKKAIEVNKRLGDIVQTYESEKYQLQRSAEEKFQAESRSRHAEIIDVKSSKDSEIQTLKDNLKECETTFQEKIRVLEEKNRKLHEEKSLCQMENERISSRLGLHETSTTVLKNEVTSLRNRLESITAEKAVTEKNLRELQVLLASLESCNTDQKNTISQSEAQMASTELVYADAKQTISRQHALIGQLQRSLTDSHAETVRYKELTERYQTNRVEMKKRIKEKAAAIQEYEETIRSRDKETADLKDQLQCLKDNLSRAEGERDAAVKVMAENKKKMEEDRRKLENNQQVRLFLAIPFFKIQLNIDSCSSSVLPQ